MDQNVRPISPLMRKLQDALEREALASAQQLSQVAPAVNPIQTPTAAATPSTRVPPSASLPRPNFTSAAISQGRYHEPQAAPELPDPAIAEEDMTADELNANSRSRRGALVLASTVILAGAAAVAAFIFVLSPQQETSGPIPEIRPDQRQTKAAPAIEPPPLRTIEPVAVTQAPQAPVSPAPLSMGDVSTELVAPTTDGLSPPRRIGTTRILLDGDKEIKPQ